MGYEDEDGVEGDLLYGFSSTSPIDDRTFVTSPSMRLNFTGSTRSCAGSSGGGSGGVNSFTAGLAVGLSMIGLVLICLFAVWMMRCSPKTANEDVTWENTANPSDVQLVVDRAAAVSNSRVTVVQCTGSHGETTTVTSRATTAVVAIPATALSSRNVQSEAPTIQARIVTDVQVARVLAKYK